ncbi:MAG TPA: alkaline phosphatase family protein, partial [Mycobacteriales bacterium]|nr:alkaline phosphatase family protein [Mycobacteriales bacterium]
GGVAQEDAALDDATASAFSVSPANATASPATVTLSDSTKKGHKFAVTCTNGATATPAAGSVTKASKAVVTISGSASAACTFASTSGSKASAQFTLTLGAAPHAIKNVFVILMENHNRTQIEGSASAPYINGTLVPQAARAEQYFNPPGMHPSEPNYLWLEAGDNCGVADDGWPSANHQATTAHLVTQLQAAGIPWKTYQENIAGSDCPLASSGLYAVKHNPFVYFDDVTNTNNASSANCIAHVRPYGELATDLSSGAVARYNFLTPNLCDDGHDCGIAKSDQWLHQTLERIQATPWYAADGTVVVTWDEGTTSAACCQHAAGGHIATIVVAERLHGERLDRP